MATTLRVGQLAPRCKVLGPGRRAVIWFQGCARRCPGCIAPEFWPREGGREASPAQLARWVLGLSPLDGLTLTGGEPLDQAEGLVELLTAVRHERPDLSVICFTGHDLDAIEEWSPERRAVLDLIDVVIDGPYLESEAADLPFRGSRNQRVLRLTNRHTDAELAGQGCRGIEVAVEGDGFTIMGIPPPSFRHSLGEAMRAQGVDLPGFEERDGDERSAEVR